MRFKVLFIISLFFCAAAIGAGLGFSKIYLDSTENPSIYVPEIVAFDSVDSNVYNYIDYATDTSFTMTGYIKFDRSILLNCYDQFNDAFHCHGIFGDVNSLISHQNVSISTLDGSFSGEKKYEREVEYPYSGKGLFNAPDMFGDAISHSAINCMAMATSHVNDGDYDGLYNTRKLFRKNNITTVGIADTKENKVKYEDFIRDGLTIRVYSYTEKISRPIDKAFNYSVNMLKDEKDLKKLAGDVSKSKHALIDIVVCAIYFDNGGNGVINAKQKHIMDTLLDAGADVVYGTNPDVVEPMEIRSKKMKSGRTKYQFGIYSLGCMLSGAKGYAAGVPKNAGLVARFKYDQDVESTFFTDVSFSPTYCVSYPSVEDTDTAGEYVKVFAMNNVMEYLKDDGSTKSTIKVTKPQVNHPFKPDDSRYIPPKDATTEETTEDQYKTPKRHIPATTAAPPTTEMVTTEEPTTENVDTELFPTGLISKISGMAVINAKAASKKKEEYNDPFYTDHLAKKDFKIIENAYYSLPKRLFSGTKYKYFEKDGWFYIKK